MPFVQSSGVGIATGAELNYTQITADVNITDTAVGTATALISPGAITFDGSPVLLHLFGIFVCDTGATGHFITVTLFEGASQITQLGLVESQLTTSTSIYTTSMFYRFTPTAGSHTYKVCAFVPVTTGTPRITAGTGSGNNEPPAFVRFTKV